MNLNSDNKSSSAALYALGLLTPEEHAAFEARIAAGEESTGDVRALVNIVASLAEARAAQQPLAPRASLRDAVLAQAAMQNVSPLTVVRGTESAWQSMAPGIEMRTLFFDPATQTHTVLARLAAGAVYPKHRHVGNEQCYVLEGDLFTDGVVLNGGDFIVTIDGTTHTDTHTNHGCLLLLNTRLNDEILA